MKETEEKLKSSNWEKQGNHVHLLISIKIILSYENWLCCMISSLSLSCRQQWVPPEEPVQAKPPAKACDSKSCGSGHQTESTNFFSSFYIIYYTTYFFLSHLWYVSFCALFSITLLLEVSTWYVQNIYHFILPSFSAL